MTARKIKHARALEKREKFMTTVHQGNQDVLKKAQTMRIAEQKAAADAAKQRKINTSKRLAKAHNSRPTPPAQKEN